MFNSIKSIRDKFKFKFLNEKHGEHTVDERADEEFFKIQIKERLIEAIINGVNALPIIVTESKSLDAFECEIAHKGKGFVVKRIRFLARSVYFRSVFYQISKSFKISYTDESAAVMDAFFQDAKLQDFVELHCGRIIANMPSEVLLDVRTANAYLLRSISNRLSIELDNYFENNQLLLLCIARAEGVKGASIFDTDEPDSIDNDKIRSILDRRNYDRPIFEDQYSNMRKRYKANEDSFQKPFE